jgi:hypothetical protein
MISKQISLMLFPRSGWALGFDVVSLVFDASSDGLLSFVSLIHT